MWTFRHGGEDYLSVMQIARPAIWNRIPRPASAFGNETVRKQCEINTELVIGNICKDAGMHKTASNSSCV